MGWLMRPVALTFRVKVALLLSGVFLLLGVIAALQAREDMKQVLGAELEGRGVAIAHDLAASSADPLLTSDLFGLYELVNRTKLHNPDIRYVLVLGGSGEVKVNTFGSGIPQGLRKANLPPAGEREQLRRLRTEEGLILDIAVPILGGELGTVRIGMSGQRVQAAVAGFSRNLALVALLVAAAGFAISYWLAFYLTRPLSQLLKAVRLVTTGDLSQRISTPGRDEVGLLASAFNTMTVALAQQQAASGALLEKVISSQEEERKRVARELHDDLAQRLTSVLLSLDAVEAGLKVEDKGGKQAVRRARAAVDGSLDETLKLISALRPSMLDDLGLVAASRSHAETQLQPLQCQVSVSAANVLQGLSPSVETAIFRIVQEAVNNIAKHAGASSARIALWLEDGALHGEVSDNGRGFVPGSANASGTSPACGLGLRGMQERASLLGGALSIVSAVGQGTKVSFSIPLRPGERDD